MNGKRNQLIFFGVSTAFIVAGIAIALYWIHLAHK